MFWSFADGTMRVWQLPDGEPLRGGGFVMDHVAETPVNALLSAAGGGHP